MPSPDKLWESIAPLLEVLGGRGSRLLARPHWVMLDRPAGATSIEMAWSDEQHAGALEALEGQTVRFASGHTVSEVGGTLVMRRPPDPLRRVDDVVADGWVSPLAGRVLGAASALGRNILLAGPWTLCADIAAALLAEGTRPAVIGKESDATPSAWPRLGSVAEARLYGADRIGAWSSSSEELGRLMAQASGIIGWIDARRLDRALIRFENHASAAGSSSGPMHVLASVDLVVVATHQPQPRVREVVEILLTEDGYRPMVLFASGLQPVPTALVPASAPSFVEELAQAGQTVLADELRHAVPQAAPQPAPRSAPQSAIDEILAPIVEEAPEPSVEHRGAPAYNPVGRAPRIDPTLDDAPPPGWELDRLEDEELAPDVSSSHDADAAMMAATFGLAPPPRPAGVAASSPPGYEGTFADALGRARERDAELRAELERDGSDDET